MKCLKLSRLNIQNKVESLRWFISYTLLTCHFGCFIPTEWSDRSESVWLSAPERHCQSKGAALVLRHGPPGATDRCEKWVRGRPLPLGRSPDLRPAGSRTAGITASGSGSLPRRPLSGSQCCPCLNGISYILLHLFLFCQLLIFVEFVLSQMFLGCSFYRCWILISFSLNWCIRITCSFPLCIFFSFLNLSKGENTGKSNEYKETIDFLFFHEFLNRTLSHIRKKSPFQKLLSSMRARYPWTCQELLEVLLEHLHLQGDLTGDSGLFRMTFLFWVLYQC